MLPSLSKSVSSLLLLLLHPVRAIALTFGINASATMGDGFLMIRTMTRLAVVSQEMVKIAEIEGQLRMLQENTQKNIEELKEFKEEVRKNSWDTNVIMVELRFLMMKHLAEKSKEARSSSEGGNRASQAVSGNDKVVLLAQNQSTQAKVKGNLGFQPVFPSITSLFNDIT